MYQDLILQIGATVTVTITFLLYFSFVLWGQNIPIHSTCNPAALVYASPFSVIPFYFCLLEMRHRAASAVHHCF
jgi:hypothetical protein